MKNDQNWENLADYSRFIFQDFENYLRTEVDLVQSDIGFVLADYTSSFILYGISPGIYTFKALSEVLTRFFQLGFDGFNRAIHVEKNGITMETKLMVRLETTALTVDKLSFFNIILGVHSHWNYKQHNEYISQKIINFNTIRKIHLKLNVIDSSVLNGTREPTVFRFILCKLSVSRVFWGLETIHYKKQTNLYRIP